MDAYEYLLSNIKKEIGAITDSLASGTAKDYADYQHLCGKVRGLLVAEDLILDLQKRMENDDE